MGNIIPLTPLKDDALDPHQDLESIRICNPDTLEIGKEYSFNPPLDIANVDILSKCITHHGYRHPNFLKGAIQMRGLSQGKFMELIETEDKNIRIGQFQFEHTFDNEFTNKEETVLASVLVKFSKEPVLDGTKVHVEQVKNTTACVFNAIGSKE